MTASPWNAPDGAGRLATGLAAAVLLGVMRLAADPGRGSSGRVPVPAANPTCHPTTLTFDPENWLTAYGTALTCGYRADGLRAWKQAGSARTYFLYDGARPVVEMRGSGAVTAINTFAATGLLARHSGSASTFYTFGPQGSVAQRLSSTGTVLSSHAYDAFGSPLGAPAAGEPFGYGAQAGYYTDQETGLVLCGQRYYDPAQGRFLNRDPSGYQGGINLYAYCGSSPANQADPSGLGGGDQWYDRLGQLAQSSAGTAKGFYNDGLTDPSFGTAGVLAATAVNTGIDIVSGLFQLPEMLSHLGEGTECFWDHPSWDTLPYLVQDIGVAGAAVGAVGAASLGAAAEAEVAEGGEVATAESAGEGAECTRGGCFAAGVPVRMADGSTKPVEQIQPGDRVKSRDPETGVVASKRVVRTFIHTVDHLVVLTLPGGEQIETTEVHPFYVAGRGFVEAGKLGIGTSIVTRAGPTLTIMGIERRPGRAQVYNFEVEGFHTYFVGRSGGGVWVHNAIPCDEEGNVYYRGSKPGEPPDMVKDFPGHYRIKGGMVQATKGASVNTNPNVLIDRFGEAHPIEDLPEGLRIEPGRGTHAEVVPSEPTPPDVVPELLGRVKYGPPLR